MSQPSEVLHVSTVELTAAVSLHSAGDSVELRSGSCLECAACRGHLLDHCTSPGDPTPMVRWSGGRGDVNLQAWASLLTAVDVLIHGQIAFPRVGVIGARRQVQLVGDVLAGAGVPTAVVVTEPELSPDSNEARVISTSLRQGAPGQPGPPDVVLATDDNLVLAARLVRRGGSVAAVGRGTASVPMASLVQRELSVLVARDRVGAASGGPLLAVVDGWARQEDPRHG